MWGVVALFAKDGGRVPLSPGREHEQVVEQLRDDAVSGPEGLNRHCTALLEAEEVHPTERRRVLVLLANRLTQDIDLDMRGFVGELTCRDTLPPQGMERVEQADGEAARPTQAA